MWKCLWSQFQRIWEGWGPANSALWSRCECCVLSNMFCDWTSDLSSFPLCFLPSSLQLRIRFPSCFDPPSTLFSSSIHLCIPAFLPSPLSFPPSSRRLTSSYTMAVITVSATSKWREIVSLCKSAPAQTLMGESVASSIASFPGSHTPECKHWSCAGVQSLSLKLYSYFDYIMITREKPPVHMLTFQRRLGTRLWVVCVVGT